MRASKKIVIIQDYLRNGGTERQSLHLAGAFAEAGHEVTLLTFRPGGALAPHLKSEISNFKFLSLQPFDTHLDFFAPRLRAAIRRLAPDIILCMGRMANCKAGRLARAFPCVAVLSTMRTGKKLPRAYIRSLHATRHTIANSHEAARLLRDRYAVPAEKITVIHNAIVIPPSGSEISNLKSLPSEARSLTILPLRLLCVAMFRPEKNHRELLELFSKLPATPAVDLHLIGDGSELAPCRALAQKLNIADRVHFHGYISNPAPFYQEADIAVLTSRTESLPNFLVEAHAHGIPSIAYAVGGVAECGGIAIPPNAPPAFLAALERLIASPAARAAESARVAAYAREHFSRETQLRRYFALFENLL